MQDVPISVAVMNGKNAGEICAHLAS